MASNLFGGHDGFAGSRISTDLGQLAKLHVLQALAVLGQTHGAHEPFLIVDEPPLPVNRHDRDVIACDVSAVFQHTAAAEYPLMNLAALDAFLPNQRHAGRGYHQRGLFIFQIVAGVFLLVAQHVGVDVNLLFPLLDYVVFRNVNGVLG